jgi:2,3-bisphosphoglycerate-dependent phosphoglycerate mutase
VTTTLFLVRHAQAVPPGPGFEDELTRPLSQLGRTQAAALAPALLALDFDVLASSPYARARQTLEPLASASGLAIHSFDDFREHRLSDKPLAGWRELLEAQYLDSDLPGPEGDTMRASQERGWRALEEAARCWPGARIALAGHGGIITLVLRRLAPDLGFAFNMDMANPALFCLEVSGGEWRWNPAEDLIPRLSPPGLTQIK